MTRWLAPAAWILVACGNDAPSEVSGTGERAPVEVRVLLDGAPRPGGGNLLVQTDYADEGSVEIGQPVSEGLSFTPNGPPDMEDLGQRDVVTQRYVYQGRSGHYEIGPVTVTWTPPDGEPVQASSSSVFLDIESDPITAGELADIEDPTGLWDLPWLPILSVAAVFVAGLGVAFWPRRRAPVEQEVPLSPDQLALRLWEDVRWNEAFTDEQKARELSVIFRAYVEAALGFEASAWTTSEIVRQLQGMAHLPEGNVLRAKRMLRATDRIKFADERSPAELLDELDSDLRAFITDTRPSSWGAS